MNDEDQTIKLLKERIAILEDHCDRITKTCLVLEAVLERIQSQAEIEMAGSQNSAWSYIRELALANSEK